MTTTRDWLTEEMNRQAAAGIPNLDNVTDPDLIGAYGLQPDHSSECAACDGDGCTWHPSPTNGATEIDGPCPSCRGTGKAPR